MFNNCFKDKKVLVTGNTGFKGSWLSLWLLELGADVFGLANGIPTNPSMYEVLGLTDKINHYDADVRDYSHVKKIIQRVHSDRITGGYRHHSHSCQLAAPGIGPLKE